MDKPQNVHVFGCLARRETGEIIDAGWIVLIPFWGVRVFHDQARQAESTEYRVDQGFRFVTVMPALYSEN